MVDADEWFRRTNPALHRVAQNQFCLRAKLWRKDTDTGEMGWGYGGTQIVIGNGHDSSPTVDQIGKRCFVAARDYSEHEIREAFTYKGRRVLDPHQSIENLWEISREA